MTKSSKVPFSVSSAGATAATRYVGGTASGAPSTGTFVVGDFAVAQNGHVWICTTGGSPGTWTDAGSYGGGSAALPTVVSITTSTTVAANTFVEANATSGALTVTLPSAPAAGSTVTVKKVDSSTNQVTVAPSSGTIDGDPTASIIAQWAGGTFLYDGTNWLLASPTRDGGGVVVAAPANMVTTDTTQTVTGAKTFQTASAAATGLVVKGTTSQTGNLQEWQDSTGAVKASLSPLGTLAAASLSLNSGGGLGVIEGPAVNGRIAISGKAAGSTILSVADHSSLTYNAYITSLAAARTGLIVQGAASQTANLTEWTENGNTTPSAWVDSLGKVTAGSLYVRDRYDGGRNGGIFFRSSNNTTETYDKVIEYDHNSGSLVLKPNGLSINIVKASWNASNGDGWTFNVASSPVLSLAGSTGRYVAGLFQPTSTGQNPLGVRGASGQTADLQVWESWNGASATTVARVSKDGYIYEGANRVYSAGNPPPATDLSSYATQTYVQSQVTALVNSAPSALDTLNELAAALGNDANFSTTVTNSIATKATDNTVVHLAGIETITAQKTFGATTVTSSGTPTSPSNTLAFQSEFWNGSRNFDSATLFLTQPSAAYGVSRLTTQRFEATAGLWDSGNRVYSAGNLVPVAGLSATGTASATTYLRGDGTWASNVLTTDTTQSISGTKTFTSGPTLPSGATFDSQFFSNTPSASSGTPTQVASGSLLLRTNYWTGSASVSDDAVFGAGRGSTEPGDSWYGTSRMLRGSAVVATGWTGATAASRYAGATTSGAPTTGTYRVGDFVVAQTGTFYICTAAGTPGTWTQVQGAVTSVNTRTGAVTGLAEDSAVVHNTGNETITGAKTFSASTGSGAVIVSPNTTASAGTTTVNSPYFAFYTQRWNGSASATEALYLSSSRRSATAGDFVLKVETGISVNSSITGATTSTAYVGGTTSGAPTTGTFSPGDWVVARDGVVWICTASGTPGTWVGLYSSANKVPVSGLSTTGTASSSTFLRGDGAWTAEAVTSVNTRTGAVTGLAEDNTVVHLTGTETITGAKTFQNASGTGMYSGAAASNNLLQVNYGRASGTPDLIFGIPNATGNFFQGTAAGDAAIRANGTTLHLGQGGGSGAAQLTVAASAVTANVNLYEGANRVYSAGNKVPVAGISATGTADATTYLRGDGTWATVSGGGGAVTSVNTRTGAVTGLAEDSAVVHNTGTETVAGAKTFTGNITFPYSGNVIFAAAATATSGATTQESAYAEFQTSWWNGSSAVSQQVNLRGSVDTAGSTYLSAPGSYFQTFALKVTGASGVATTTRYAGGVSNTAPTTGTWTQGDWVVGTSGTIFICTVSGTPGTWVSLYSSSNVVPPSGLNNAAGGVASATTFYRGDGAWATPAAPSNMVTTNTTQTISGDKTFTASGGFGTTFSASTGSAAVYLNDTAAAAPTSGQSAGSPAIVGAVRYNNGGGSAFTSTSLYANINSDGSFMRWTTSAAVQSTSGGIYDGTNRVYSLGNKVPVAGISATGTADAATFLRGDGAWATPLATPSNMVTTDTTQTITGTKIIEQQGLVFYTVGGYYQTQFQPGSNAVFRIGAVAGTNWAGLLVDGTVTQPLGSPTAPHVAIKGQASNTTNDLIQFQDSTSAVLARVSATGQIYEGANRVYSPANPPETVVTKTAAYTAVSGNIILANGTFTVTLPSPSVNVRVTVKNIGTGTVTLTGPAPAAVTDAFTRTSTTTPGTADTGQAWIAVRGTWGTNGSQGYSVTAANDDVMAQNVGSADMIVSAKIGTLVSNGYYGIGARCSTDGNTMYFIEVGPTGAVQVFRRVASANTLLGAAGTAVSGSVLQITVVGSAITTRVDGAQTTNFTDSGITTGNYAALRHGSTATVSLPFDNFSAQSQSSTVLIDGGSNAVLATQYASITTVSDGSSYFII